MHAKLHALQTRSAGKSQSNPRDRKKSNRRYEYGYI
jgi:hypothetical protein